MVDRDTGSYPVTSPLELPQPLPWWWHVPIAGSLWGFGRYSARVHRSVKEQVSSRPRPPQPWADDPIKSKIAGILASSFNKLQFGSDHAYHPDDPLWLLTIHPTDDMTIADAIAGVEHEFGIRVLDLSPGSTFGELVDLAHGLVVNGDNRGRSSDKGISSGRRITRRFRLFSWTDLGFFALVIVAIAVGWACLVIRLRTVWVQH